MIATQILPTLNESFRLFFPKKNSISKNSFPKILSRFHRNFVAFLVQFDYENNFHKLFFFFFFILDPMFEQIFKKIPSYDNSLKKLSEKNGIS